MILFNATLTVKKVEQKSVPTKTGKTFRFTEAICTTDEEKPTVLVARLSDEMEVYTGEKALFKVGISSYEGKDGRFWNNFVLLAKQSVQPVDEKPVQPLETVLMDDELPF